MPSIRRRAMAWVWGSRSAARSSRSIKGSSGQGRTTARAPPSPFPFPPDSQALPMQQPDDSHVTYTRSLVSVVDADESVRESLPDLLRMFGFDAEAFSSAEAFLASESMGDTSCLLLDIAMPGMSGPQLQRELARRRQQ